MLTITLLGTAATMPLPERAPVSYTHLDVYKRQSADAPVFRNYKYFFLSLCPERKRRAVSYTHLDVYKRQG